MKKERAAHLTVCRSKSKKWTDQHTAGWRQNEFILPKSQTTTSVCCLSKNRHSVGLHFILALRRCFSSASQKNNFSPSKRGRLIISGVWSPLAQFFCKALFNFSRLHYNISEISCQPLFFKTLVQTSVGFKRPEGQKRARRTKAPRPFLFIMYYASYASRFSMPSTVCRCRSSVTPA